MPPFAGQGLNSGIRDAANLCWKIADVLTGRLADAALDTYQQERRPHAEATGPSPRPDPSPPATCPASSLVTAPILTQQLAHPSYNR